MTRFHYIHYLPDDYDSFGFSEPPCGYVIFSQGRVSHVSAMPQRVTCPTCIVFVESVAL